jgi:hypothetical protein
LNNELMSSNMQQDAIVLQPVTVHPSTVQNNLDKEKRSESNRDAAQSSLSANIYNDPWPGFSGQSTSSR